MTFPTQPVGERTGSPAPAHPPTPTQPIPTAGKSLVRVRYCECDPMGLAHHASYIPWLEIARTELLRAGGITYAELEASGVLLVVAKLNVMYRRPIRYDDMVEVACRVVGGGRVKLDHEYTLRVLERAGTPRDALPQEPVAVAATTLACVDREGKVRPLPDWLTPSASQARAGHAPDRPSGLRAP